MVQNPSVFSFSTDYITPYVTYKTEGSIFNPNGEEFNGCLKIKHNLPYTPLLFGIWSLNQDFSNSHSVLPDRIGVDDGFFSALSDDNYIYIKAYNNSSRATYYYKLYAYSPPDVEVDKPPYQDTTNFLFNTDNRYLQLYQYGKVKPTGRIAEVYHSLGYTPVYKIWKTFNIDFWQSGQGVVTIRAIGNTEAFYDPDLVFLSTPINDAADAEKLVVSWHERQPDNNDFAYYQIYTMEG